MKSRKAIVVGAGIGGLTAALALQKAGFAVEVYEQAPELKEAGAGISLWANAIRALEQLGFGNALRERSVAYARTAILRSDGRTIVEISLDELVQRLRLADTPVVVVLHRADLLDILTKPLGNTIRLGHRCAGFEIRGERVAARFADGTEAEGDLLIGADGIHSSVRAQLHPGDALRYSGYTAWRAVVKFDSAGWGVTESWGAGKRFGVVPMSGGSVYWFATQNTPEGGRAAAGGAKQELSELFRGWHEPIPRLISAIEESAILRNDIVDRDPLRTWGSGPVTLLGDAAHPMTPNLGQGGCQAIEDALALARSVSNARNVPEALRNYEFERIRRTTPIVLGSRRSGRLAQWDNPLACRLRDALLAKMPHGVLVRQLEPVAGYTGHLN